MSRLIAARRVANIVFGAAASGALVALWYRSDVAEFVKDYDTVLKLIGLGIGPVLAFIGFFLGRVDKAELRDLTDKHAAARTTANMEKKNAEAAKSEVDAKVKRIAELEKDLQTIADSARLWKLRPNAPFQEYRGWKHDPEGAKIVTMALFKGGVGKTHLSANFAAYVSEKQKKPVLLIDMDYQGSLSTAMLSAAGVVHPGSMIDKLFTENANLATLCASRLHLAKVGDETALNQGNGLSRVWIVPADYTLNSVESRLLVERVIHQRESLDERYRLAHLLLHPEVRREYAMIIIDSPPRMTLGTVNAFVASHNYVVPSILDKVSSEAVRPFLEQVKLLQTDLELRLELAGIVGTMTRQLQPTDTETKFLKQIEETATEVLGAGRRPYVVPQTLPRKAQITQEDDLGYFLRDAQGPLRDRFYDAIFDELWTRINSPHESS